MYAYADSLLRGINYKGRHNRPSADANPLLTCTVLPANARAPAPAHAPAHAQAPADHCMTPACTISEKNMVEHICTSFDTLDGVV